MKNLFNLKKKVTTQSGECIYHARKKEELSSIYWYKYHFGSVPDCFALKSTRGAVDVEYQKIIGIIKDEDFQNENIAKYFFCIYCNTQGWYIGMEYFDAQTLDGICCDEIKRQLEVAIMIFRGLKYLHSKSIIHRDIKPENVLYQANMSSFGCILKIIDFNLATTKSSSKTFAGSLAFIAPEVAGDRRYCNKVDVWSSGATIFYLIDE